MVLRLFMFLLLSINVAFASNSILLTSSNTVFLDQEFSLESTNEVVAKVQAMSPFTTKYLVLISPGGSVVAGLDMIDNLRGISKNIHTITIFSASMAFATVQSLGTRYITKHGVLMSHRARGGMQGQFPNGELESRLNFWNKRINDLDQETVNRTKGIMTLEQYQKLIANELWCEGANCVKLGLADRVVDVKCAQSLLGTFEKTLKFEFLGKSITLVVKRSSCPLIQGYELIDAKVQGSVYKRNILEINTFIDESINKLNSNKMFKH
jgi:ATP-dependent protease ClpP protease subunit